MRQFNALRFSLIFSNISLHLLILSNISLHLNENLPVRRGREFARQMPDNIDKNLAQKGPHPLKFKKFPVLFPASREIGFQVRSLFLARAPL